MNTLITYKKQRLKQHCRSLVRFTSLRTPQKHFTRNSSSWIAKSTLRCGMITQPLVVTATSWSSFVQYMTLRSITLQKRLKSKRESKWMSQIWSKNQRFTYLAGRPPPLKTKCFIMNAGGSASKTFCHSENCCWDSCCRCSPFLSWRWTSPTVRSWS